MDNATNVAVKTMISYIPQGNLLDLVTNDGLFCNFILFLLKKLFAIISLIICFETL